MDTINIYLREHMFHKQDLHREQSHFEGKVSI